MIIFDCDGVLVESEVLVVRHEEAALKEVGFDVSFDEIVEQFVGLSYASMEASLVAQFGRPLPEGFFAKVQADALARFPDELEPVAGMVEFVASVQGKKCVASSSGLDRINLSLEVTGHATNFDQAHIFSAQMVERGKPEPDLFLHAAEQMGVDPTNCIVIEDSAHGVRGALAAEMAVIGLIAGGHCIPTIGNRLSAAGANAIARSVDELPGLVAKLRSLNCS